MKLEFNENDYGIDITLIPENTHEYSQLLRYSRNAKQEKPSVYLSFSNQPYCNIHLNKLEKHKQGNFVEPQLKRRK